MSGSGSSSSSLRHTLARKFLRHADFYNNDVAPFFRATPQFAVQAYCLRDNKEMMNAVTKNIGADNSGKGGMREEVLFPPMESLLRGRNNLFTASSSSVFVDSAAAPALLGSGGPMPHLKTAMDCLRQLQTWKSRMLATTQRRLAGVHYEFEVGDIVQHVELNHIGVVAAKMPICFETDEWIVDNLGSLTDHRLAHPWYLVLVARHDPLPYDFVRYGSQLTHVRVNSNYSIGSDCNGNSICSFGSIGCHRMLPMFFRGFCSETGRYIAREENVREEAHETLLMRRAEQELMVLQSQVPVSVSYQRTAKKMAVDAASAAAKESSISVVPEEKSKKAKRSTTTASSSSSEQQRHVLTPLGASLARRLKAVQRRQPANGKGKTVSSVASKMSRTTAATASSSK